MLGRSRLMGPELGRVRRAVVAASAFRDAVGAVATDDVVDELGRLWLQRPVGWRERVALVVRLDAEREERQEAERLLGRERKRREAAEAKWRKAQDATSGAGGRVASLQDRLRRLQAELEASRADVDAMREELQAAKTAERHAVDRQRAAEERLAEATRQLEAAMAQVATLELQRDELLAARIQAGTGSTLNAPSMNELRSVAEQMRRLSGRLSEVVAPATSKRAPLAIPGGIVGDATATAEHLVRSSARIIVDGYNVAKLVWPSLELADQRARLIELADNVARRFAAAIVVVFDGTDVVGAAATGRHLVRVVYSPPGVSADDVIRDEVAATPPDQSITVVTNDREIQRDVVREGANALASEAFSAVGLG